MKLNPMSLQLPLVAVLLASCGTQQEAAEPDKPLSQLSINSAKRQCVSVAVLQQVPQDAAKSVCDCTVESLIEKAQFTEGSMPSDEQQQAALNTCVEEYDPEAAPAAAE